MAICVLPLLMYTMYMYPVVLNNCVSLCSTKHLFILSMKTMKNVLNALLVFVSYVCTVLKNYVFL